MWCGCNHANISIIYVISQSISIIIVDTLYVNYTLYELISDRVFLSLVVVFLRDMNFSKTILIFVVCKFVC